MKGATRRAFSVAVGSVVSIHAPNEGSDCIDEMSPDQVKETDYVRMIQAQIINARYVSGEAGETGTVIAGNFTLFHEADLPTVPDWIATRLKQGVTVWNNDPDFRPQLGDRR
jgi:hypothetical protein